MNKILWITGASSGIGKASALKFAENGWTVIALARRISLLKNLSNTKNLKGKIIPIKLDICNSLEVKKTIESSFKKYGTPTICFLNAGTHLADEDNINALTAFKKLIDVNLLGTVSCIYKCLPYLKLNPNSQLVIMASLAGYRGLPDSSAYCSSKAALISLAESLYHECKDNGVKVRLINPGFVDTPLTRKNKFAMPSIINVKLASDKIFERLTKGKEFEIRFPKYFSLLMKFLSILPYPIYFYFTKYVVKKS